MDATPTSGSHDAQSRPLGGAAAAAAPIDDAYGWIGYESAYPLPALFDAPDPWGGDAPGALAPTAGALADAPVAGDGCN